MNNIPTTGAIPSEPDYRDGLAGASVSIEAGASSLPAELITDIKALAVLDQNKDPACVSHAWALVMKYYWWKETGQIIDFSPRYLDIMSNEDWIPADGGRVPRTVAKVSAKHGCCTTALLPNDTEGIPLSQYRDRDVLTNEMHAEAAKYKIPGYVRISDNSVADFRNAIAQYGLVSGLFSISDNFWIPSWNTSDIDPLRTKAPTSNHQMVVYGWSGALNYVRNSWSELWNRKGNGTYSAGAWLPYISEGWAIAHIPTNVQAFLSSLPKPADFHYQWDRDLEAGNTAPDDDVKFAQIALMMLGCMKPVAPDQLGYYGARTAQAVLDYQTRKRVPREKRNAYRIGPLTRGFLNAEFTL